MLHIGGFGMLLSLFPFLFVFLHLILAKELKVIKRGKIELVDETQLLGPDVDYSQEFEAEAKKGAQLGDLYDEQLAALPRFEVHKNGKNIGWTRMPVLNQKKAHWSTPLPRLRFGEPAAATYSTPKLEPITLGRPFPPTPLESIEVETLPPPPPPPPTQPPETPKTQQPTTTAAKPKTTQTAKTTPVPATTEMAEPTEMSTKLTQKPTTKSVLFSTQKSAKPAETQKSTGVPKSMEIPSRRPFSLGKTSPSPNSVPSTTRTATSTSRRPQQDDDELAAAAASARLRKKLLVLRPKPHGTEVEVKSNKIAIRPFSSSPPPSPGDHKKAGFGSRTTPSSLTAIPGGFAWSRSWSIGPDGRIEIRTWDRDHGQRVDVWLLSSAEKQRWLHGGQGGLTPPLADTTTRRPALIQAGAHRQQLGSSAAAAFECRLLDAAKDGQPSEANDPSCPLDFPGIPSDGSCKCNYQVSDRDAQGCATGFIYTCVRRQNSAAGPDEQEPAPFAGARRRQ